MSSSSSSEVLARLEPFLCFLCFLCFLWCFLCFFLFFFLLWPESSLLSESLALFFRFFFFGFFSELSDFNFLGNGDSESDLSESESDSCFLTISGDSARFPLIIGDLERCRFELLVLFGDGVRDLLSSSLDSSPEYKFTVGFAALKGGFGDALRMILGLGLDWRPLPDCAGDLKWFKQILMIYSYQNYFNHLNSNKIKVIQ